MTFIEFWFDFFKWICIFCVSGAAFVLLYGTVYWILGAIKARHSLDHKKGLEE